jgi:hypothetical protein
MRPPPARCNSCYLHYQEVRIIRSSLEDLARGEVYGGWDSNPHVPKDNGF